VPRVFVTRQLPGGGIERLRQLADVSVWPDHDPPPADVLRDEASKSDGLLTLLTDRIDGELLDAAPGVRIVANMAVGYDNIDVAGATQRGVLVTNTPGVLTETTADLAFALILAFARRIPAGERVVREGRWGLWHPTDFLGRDVNGATLGIVGLGAIGLAVARRACGFGMRLLYCSRHRKPEAEAELGVEWRSLDDLLGQSDFVSLHVALTPETRNLIGARELALMKPDGVLVNTSRGGVVDQAALVQALRERRIGGAALDVFALEPLPPDDPLLALDNVLVAPHVGSATIETRTKMADLAIDNLIAFFRGERPPTCVNPEVLGANS
jgi:glyoxylate reductase